MATFVVHPSAFRSDILTELRSHEIDVAASGLERGCQQQNSIFGPRYHLVTHIKAPYPSLFTEILQQTALVLARVITCNWCCQYSRQKEAPASTITPTAKDSLLDTAVAGDEWPERNAPVGIKRSFYSYGNMFIRPLASSIGVELLDHPRGCGPSIAGFFEHLNCKRCCKTMGTPQGPISCCKTLLAWIVAFLLFPFGILALIWDFLLLPICMIAMVPLVGLLVEPVGVFLGFCCAMWSSRGLVMRAVVYERYHLVNTTKEGLQIDARHEQISEFILAEHVNLFKAIWLQTGASNPRKSLHESLVRNPIWGLFDASIPASSVSSAWFELIIRSGGRMPQTT
eukprot:gb/GECG01000956.1/.p1 GENE.gb/GECG01000956.1/~~gb/GECG01000956.1/.p1  ORF type:complete len:341 (+),score=9.28 gb/GECG01000956.1/:1-1023(+)